MLRKEARRAAEVARGDQPSMLEVDGVVTFPLAPRERRYPPPERGENRTLNGFYAEQRPHPSYPMPEVAS